MFSATLGQGDCLFEIGGHLIILTAVDTSQSLYELSASVCVGVCVTKRHHHQQQQQSRLTATAEHHNGYKGI